MNLRESMNPKELQKLISLTFDSDPRVRKEAALKLAETDDPGAAFALLELTYDKNEEVAKTAKEVLDRKGKKEPKYMSITELFAKNGEEKKEGKERKDNYGKLLEPIDRIFEKTLGKERAKTFKEKLMPQIIKSGEKTEGKERRKEVVQGVLLAYLKELGLEEVSEIKNKEDEKKIEKIVEDITDKEGEIEEISSMSEVAIKEIDEAKNDNYFKIEYKGEEIEFDSSIKPVFQLALNTLINSDDERFIKKQKENIKKFFNNQIELAFRIAKEKLKRRKIVNITEIRDGMKMIYTDNLKIKSITKKTYMRTKTKRDVFYRLEVEDGEGNTGVIYIFGERGNKIKYLREGMEIRLEKAKAKYFSFSGETALVVSKATKIISEL